MIEAVVCKRVADGPPAAPSTRRRCDRCGARVWLSLVTQRDACALWEHRIPIVCTHCVPGNVTHRIGPQTAALLARGGDRAQN